MNYKRPIMFSNPAALAAITSLFTSAIATKLTPPWFERNAPQPEARRPRHTWFSGKPGPKEERRVSRRRMRKEERRADSLRSMAKKNVIPVRIGDKDFFNVASYKKCSAMELYDAGFEGVL